MEVSGVTLTQLGKLHLAETAERALPRIRHGLTSYTVEEYTYGIPSASEGLEPDAPPRLATEGD